MREIEIEINTGLQAFLDMMWYAGQETFVHYAAIYIQGAALKNKGMHILPDAYINENCRDLWGMLVLLYGDYGTSPFSGWIEREYAADAVFNLTYWLKEYNVESEDEPK